MIVLPLHPDVVKRALGKGVEPAEKFVKFVASRKGIEVIARVNTMWAQSMTAHAGQGGMADTELSELHERAHKIMKVLFNIPRLKFSPLAPFDYTVLSDPELVDGLIAICELQDYWSFDKDFTEPMEQFGPWLQSSLMSLRKLLELAS